MEVLAVGAADMHWRETSAQPPYPVVPARTATFLNGSLLWTVDERHLGPGGATAAGFLRFSLEDETFGVTPAPPCRPRLDYAGSSLTELRGELCVARMEPTGARVLELWMGGDAVHPRWELRHTVHVTNAAPLQHLRPVAMFEDGIVFHQMAWVNGEDFVRGYDFQTRAFKDIVQMRKLRYHGDGSTTEDRRAPRLSKFFLIPYRESLVRI